MNPLWPVALAVLAVNIPFGFWRAGVRKFSAAWFLAVHIPVLIAIGVRLLSKLGWSFATFPVLISAFFLGQLLGGLLRRLWKKKPDAGRTAL